jgi:hypothetical protein
MTDTTTDVIPATGICTRCHRALKDPKSIERGRGPVCERKYRAAVEEAAKLTSEAQVDKAVALLAAGGVVQNASDSFYTVTTASGTYRTDRTLCTCQAGQNGRTCYHLVAVCLVELKAVKLAPVS